MRTTTNTGSEQGQRIGHFRSSPPRTIKTASRLRSSPEVERFTVLCASYSVVLDNRLRSWDANERSIFNLPLLLIPEITNLRVISKKRLFSIFRVLCSYIYIYIRMEVFVMILKRNFEYYYSSSISQRIEKTFPGEILNWTIRWISCFPSTPRPGIHNFPDYSNCIRP